MTTLASRVVERMRAIRDGAMPEIIEVDDAGNVVRGAEELTALHLLEVHAARVIAPHQLRRDQRSPQLAAFADDLTIADRRRSVRRRFADARPYPYAFLDSVLHADLADAIAAELPALPWDLVETDRMSIHEVDLIAQRRLQPGLHELRHMVSGAAFAALLEDLTRISGLRLSELGAHQLVPGQSIGPHADSGCACRLTFTFNPGWERGDGGEFLVLVPGRRPRVADALLPVNNSAVLFEISGRSLHAVRTVTADRPRFSVVVTMRAPLVSSPDGLMLSPSLAGTASSAMPARTD